MRFLRRGNACSRVLGSRLPGFSLLFTVQDPLVQNPLKEDKPFLYLYPYFSPMFSPAENTLNEELYKVEILLNGN